jgi:hypothetical protein
MEMGDDNIIIGQEDVKNKCNIPRGVNAELRSGTCQVFIEKQPPFIKSRVFCALVDQILK